MERTILTLAEEIATKSSLRKKHCCILATSSGKILSIGLNKTGKYGTAYTKHAECDAFQHLHNYKNRRIDIYIARSGWRSSKPCHRCIKFITKMSEMYHLRNIIYTIETGIVVMKVGDMEIMEGHCGGEDE